MYSRFEREMVDRLKTLDPQTDLAELLEASAHTNPDIQQVVREKLAAHPNLRDGIATVLRTWRAEAAFTYLAEHGISAEDRTALAPAVLDGIREITRAADDEIYRSTHFHPDQFDRRTRLVLAVADRFAGLSPDHSAAVREFRRVLDTERAAKAHFNARAHLDAWLARHRATASANP